MERFHFRGVLKGFVLDTVCFVSGNSFEVYQFLVDVCHVCLMIVCIASFLLAANLLDRGNLNLFYSPKLLMCGN